MLSKAEERKSDLRNTTVMEVIIAVIIILLLVIYYKDTKFVESSDFYEAEIVKLSQKVDTLSRENSTLKKTIRELKAEVEFKDRKIKRLEEMFGPGGMPPNLSKMNTQMDLFEQENRRLREQVRRLKEKLGGDGAGSELPRCRTSLGEVPWLGDIYKDGRKFRFELAGNDTERETLMREVPGVSQLVSRNLLSVDDFRSAAMKVYTYGEKSDERCRFYVRAHRSSDFNLDDDLIIQKYFYRAIRSR